jgi:RHH-type proline utilization regulon transcriptional repressor/proline dehydrogenase/delta 1-pyrroline-5-carboxylate dehydrogenase
VRRSHCPVPTGESNTLEFHPRGTVLCMAKDERALASQAKAMRALGNTVVMLRDHHSLAVRDHLDGADIILVDKIDPAKLDAALLDLDDGRLQKIRAELAESSRGIVPVVISTGKGQGDWMRLVVERTLTVNTAAAGGNAALLSLSEDTAV